jgi:hypothetical protein
MNKAIVYKWAVEFITFLILWTLSIGAIIFTGLAARGIWEAFMFGFNLFTL